LGLYLFLKYCQAFFKFFLTFGLQDFKITLYSPGFGLFGFLPQKMPHTRATLSKAKALPYNFNNNVGQPFRVAYFMQG